MASGDVLNQFQDICCSCRFVTSHEAGLIACGIQGGKVGIWKSATEEQVQLLPSQGACILDIAFSGDGSSLITAEANGMARIWDVKEALEQQSPMHHCTDVDKVAFAPNGKLVATGQSDGLVRVWNVFEPEPDEHSEQRFDIPTQVVVDPAGKRFVLTREPGWQASPGTCIRRLDLFNMESGDQPHTAIDLDGCISTAAFSADSGSLALGISCRGNGGVGRVYIFATTDLSIAPVSIPLQVLPANLAWNPDGRRIAVIGEAGEILMIDVADGRMRSLMGSGSADQAHVNPLVAFTADGKTLASLGRDGVIRFWDVETGELRYTPMKSGSEGFWSFTLSQDNLHMATTTTNGEVRIWDLQRGIPLGPTLQHPRWVYRCRFSPDQKRLITASHDGKVRIWEWSSGKLLNGLLTHPSEVYDATFTPDNRWVITACRDGNIRIWDPKSSQIMAPPIKVGQQAFNIEITTNGHYALVGTLGDEFYILSLENFHEALPLDAEDLCLVGEVVSGCTVENGVLRDLTTGEWMERYARIQALHPEALESGRAYIIRKRSFAKKNIFISGEDRIRSPSKEKEGPLATGVIGPDRINPCSATAGCTKSCGECQFSKAIKAG
jgi:WD40 repeat protein